MGRDCLDTVLVQDSIQLYPKLITPQCRFVCALFDAVGDKILFNAQVSDMRNLSAVWTRHMLYKRPVCSTTQMSTPLGVFSL
eukprot:766818-Hanusia_phi.AAC.1